MVRPMPQAVWAQGTRSVSAAATLHVGADWWRLRPSPGPSAPHLQDELPKLGRLLLGLALPVPAPHGARQQLDLRAPRHGQFGVMRVSRCVVAARLERRHWRTLAVPPPCTA